MDKSKTGAKSFANWLNKRMRPRRARLFRPEKFGRQRLILHRNGAF